MEVSNLKLILIFNFSRDQKRALFWVQTVEKQDVQLAQSRKRRLRALRRKVRAFPATLRAFFFLPEKLKLKSFLN